MVDVAERGGHLHVHAGLGQATQQAGRQVGVHGGGGHEGGGRARRQCLGHQVLGDHHGVTARTGVDDRGDPVAGGGVIVEDPAQGCGLTVAADDRHLPQEQAPAPGRTEGRSGHLALGGDRERGGDGRGDQPRPLDLDGQGPADGHQGRARERSGAGDPTDLLALQFGEAGLVEVGDRPGGDEDRPGDHGPGERGLGAVLAEERRHQEHRQGGGQAVHHPQHEFGVGGQEPVPALPGRGCRRPRRGEGRRCHRDLRL